ncbi:MAG: thymidylate synthase [Aeromonas jandaei]
MRNYGVTIYGNNIDRVWRKLILETLTKGKNVNNTKELVATTLVMEDPRKCMVLESNRKASPYYFVGELLWYLRGSNKLDIISYYAKFWNKVSDDGVHVRSAYGHRLFNDSWRDIVGNNLNFNQWKWAIDHLKENPTSRQCVLHLNMANNVKTKDEVCTLTIQFLIRENKLDMIVNMRSNDVFAGTTNDVFMFSIFQQMMALELDVNVGHYIHNAASMHIYDFNMNTAQKIFDKIISDSSYVRPSVQQNLVMTKSTLNNIPKLLEIEEHIRVNGTPYYLDDKDIIDDEFSRTMVHVLNLHFFKKNKFIGTFIKYYNEHERQIHENFKILIRNHGGFYNEGECN